jgi:DNA polymerase elongation subunit (family B)
VVESDADNVIVDLDVASYYPNLAISNGFYPQHLGKEFCTIYKNLYEQRKTYPKKSAESAMLKLALNGVYGDSNNQFSVFYDPLYTMTITLNGQLLLCKLAEYLLWIDGLQLIQVNTDGLTVKVPRKNKWEVDETVVKWQTLTGLQLEEAIYKVMMIRDVNSYIAQYEDGSVKRKGAYEYDMEWHQNAGGLVIAKVAEKVLLENAPIRQTLEQWPDMMDFMLRTKVPRSSYLAIEHDGVTKQLQNITRYYIAQDGGRLFKWMPPLKGKQEWRKIGVESGWGVQPCNDIRDAGKLPIDFDYYVREVEKLCLGLA